MGLYDNVKELKLAKYNWIKELNNLWSLLSKWYAQIYNKCKYIELQHKTRGKYHKRIYLFLMDTFHKRKVRNVFGSGQNCI